MDRYKFRGKRLDNGEWVVGWLITNKLGSYIITEENPHECTQYGYITIEQYHRVDPATVGQYTGLKDKDGKEIYEGDILLSESKLLRGLRGFDTGKTTKTIYKVFWSDSGWYKEVLESETIVKGSVSMMTEKTSSRFNSVIGNIHDNPELLEG